MEVEEPPAEGHFTPHPSDVLDMPVDPNEPTYCLCHQVSYGEMIGCDNNDCPIGELNHFVNCERPKISKKRFNGGHSQLHSFDELESFQNFYNFFPNEILFPPAPHHHPTRGKFPQHSSKHFYSFCFSLVVPLQLRWSVVEAQRPMVLPEMPQEEVNQREEFYELCFKLKGFRMPQ